MSDYTKKAFVSWIITFFIGVGIFLGILFWKQMYSVYGFMDACFYPGAILLGIGALLWVANAGLFDSLTYGVSYIFSSFSASKGQERKYKDLSEYSDNKMEKRRENKTYYLPYFVIGGLFLMVSIVLLVIFRMGL